MRILGLIPARGGSKGVPRKNVKLLGGKPLITWTIETALDVTGLDRLIVSTEDDEVADIAQKAGAEVPFMRPDYLADDGAKSIDVVLHVLEWLEQSGETYDAVCLLQPTTPFRSANLLQECIDIFKAKNYTGLISVKEVPHQYHPNWTFVETKDGMLEPALGVGSVISRRQDLPGAFIRDGAVYITNVEKLKAKSFFGDKLGYVLNEEEVQVNIDTLQDWTKAEQSIKYLK
jgi:CMP-N-acetylneuraminic acid synthetase